MNKFQLWPLLFLLILTVACRESISFSKKTPPVAQTTSFVKLSNFQQAEIVIGQDDFVTSTPNAPSAKYFSNPYGNPTVSGGKLYLPAYNQNRILGYNSVPTTNGALADFILGQQDFTSAGSGTAADEFSVPQNLLAQGGKFFVNDYSNSRISIYNSIPTTTGAAADVVVGWPDFATPSNSCTASTLNYAEAFCVSGNKLIVADSGNNRILIWNSIPTTNGQPADIVLGQPDMTTCTDPAATITSTNFSYPAGMWCDENRLLIVDSNRHRLLLWNSIPTTPSSAPDVVIGQNDFTSGTSGLSETKLNWPYYLHSNGTQIFLADGSSRLLVWNSFPSSHLAPADVVLGQASFATDAANDDDQDGITDANPSARTFNYPSGFLVFDNQLIVSDSGNNRTLIFKGQN